MAHPLSIDASLTLYEAITTPSTTGPMNVIHTIGTGLSHIEIGNSTTTDHEGHRPTVRATTRRPHSRRIIETTIGENPPDHGPNRPNPSTIHPPLQPREAARGIGDGAGGRIRQSDPIPLDETCACCTQSVDADEAVGLLKTAELPESAGHSSPHLSGEVLGLGGFFALLTLTGAYRVAAQSRTLIPALRTSIQTYTPPMDLETAENIATSNRLKQLKRSLHNAQINLGTTLANVATTAGMLASLAIATPVGWGLLAGYAASQTMRNLQLAWRTRQDLNTHQNAHPIAITHYQQRQTAYLRISASFAIQGMGAALIIGGMASGVGAPLALVGLALVLTGSGGSLWLNNQYTRAYAPRNNSHWGIDRDTLPVEKRHELMMALKEAKEARRTAYRLTPSYQKNKWIKKGLRVMGALPMLTSWQNQLNTLRKQLNQQRDKEVEQLAATPRWKNAETACREVIATIVTPTPLVPSRAFRVGNMKCSNQNCQDSKCNPDTTATLQLEWGAIRYMLRALCDDEMTKENEVTGCSPYSSR